MENDMVRFLGSL